MNNESECFTGISKHENGEYTRVRVFSSIIFECLDIPVGHELELSYGFSNESRRDRMFLFVDLILHA